MVLKLGPNHQAAYLNLGEIILKLSEYQDAFKMLCHTVEITPNDLIALQDLGSALLVASEHEEVVCVKEQALELDLNSISRWSD